MAQREKERAHSGFRVSSAEIPAHKDHHAIWIPVRIPRRLWRGLVEIGRRSLLPDSEEESLSRPEADAATTEWLKTIAIHWNWEDGEGEPLPQPGGDPGVWEEIADDEFRFIVRNITAATTIPPRKPTA